MRLIPAHIIPIGKAGRGLPNTALPKLLSSSFYIIILIIRQDFKAERTRAKDVEIWLIGFSN